MTTNEPRVSREHILALAKKCGMVWGYTTTELVDAVIGFAYVVLNDKAVQEARTVEDFVVQFCKRLALQQG